MKIFSLVFSVHITVKGMVNEAAFPMMEEASPET